MRKILVFGFILICVCGCPAPDQESKDRDAVDEQQTHYGIVQPIPKFEFSVERDASIQIYEGRNKHVTTWTVWRSNSGLIEGYCESIGFPLPYDVQLTNPTRTSRHHHSSVLEQAEPNGLFSSKNTSATWVRQVFRKDNKVFIVPVYIESKVTCYPYPITVDYEKNRVISVSGSEPSLEIKKRDS